MGNIYHSWNGTVLTITSDSGTSSADLKGDTGVRGAQGIPGIVIDTNSIVARLNELEARIAALEPQKVNFRGKTVIFNCLDDAPYLTNNKTVLRLSDGSYIEVLAEYSYYCGYGVLSEIADTGNFDSVTIFFSDDADYILDDIDASLISYTIEE